MRGGLLLAGCCRPVYGNRRPKADAVLTKLSNWEAGHAPKGDAKFTKDSPLYEVQPLLVLAVIERITVRPQRFQLSWTNSFYSEETLIIGGR